MKVQRKQRLLLPRKAMLLAAGKGTRLHPVTDAICKCMITIGQKPVLEHNIEWLRQHGVTDVIINLHYLPETIKNYFGDGHKWEMNISYSYEPELLGSAGAVRNVSHFFDGPFFVWYGDNLSNCRLDSMWQLHLNRGGIATIALHQREDPAQSGIVALDENDRITRFLEKPARDEIFSHWVSAGIFVFEPQILEMIPPNVASDFGRDIFPSLLKEDMELYGYRMAEQENLWWIDTPGDLRSVRALFNRPRNWTLMISHQGKHDATPQKHSRIRKSTVWYPSDIQSPIWPSARARRIARYRNTCRHDLPCGQPHDRGRASRC
ncbi:MAG TPA: nucleotidyltransferase family protein [Pyrinomonadaceae bacterium]|nr:nucleotidyltransferase family protein [Pyrinomonadaceae bacterium]